MCFINGNQCQVSLEQSGSKYVPPWGCFTSVSNGYSNWIGLWKVLVCPSPEGTPSIAALTLPSRPFISCFTLACRQKVLGFSSCRNPETREIWKVKVISSHNFIHTKYFLLSQLMRPSCKKSYLILLEGVVWSCSIQRISWLLIWNSKYVHL